MQDCYASLFRICFGLANAIGLALFSMRKGTAKVFTVALACTFAGTSVAETIPRTVALGHAAQSLSQPSKDEESRRQIAVLTTSDQRATIGGLEVSLQESNQPNQPVVVIVECIDERHTPRLTVDETTYGRGAQLVNLTQRAEHSCASYRVNAARLATSDIYNMTSVAGEIPAIGIAIHMADVAGSDRTVGPPSVFTFNNVYGNWAQAKAYKPSEREHSKAYATLNQQSQRFIAGAIALPEQLQAGPASNQPGSISDSLDQVSPSNGYLKIDDIKPDNKGMYGLDLPLLLRPSRGPGPSFSVRYASNGTIGVLGRGWDLSFSSVEVRGPSPIYHPAYETEDYVLDGAELIALDGTGKDIPPLYKGGPIIPRISGDRYFRLRNNSSGLIIKRHGSGPNNYYWEVWNPNSHVTRLYGAKLQDDGSLAVDETSNALLRGTVRFRNGSSTNVIGQWGLTQEFDNQPARSGSSYHYARTMQGERCQSSSWGGDCRAALRLSSIDYNQVFGKSDVSGWEHGATTVLFDWQEREQTRFVSDGRLGFLQAQEFWLRQINVVYTPEAGNLWLSASNSTVSATIKELQSASGSELAAKAETGVLKSLDGRVVFSSHSFILGDEDQPCMNFERVLKTYKVWANPLVDGGLVRADSTTPRDEVQSFTFDYSGEACTAKWSAPQNIEATMAPDIGLQAPSGKLNFPSALITDLGFDILQQRSPLGTSRTEEVGASLYVGVGPADRLTAKPVSGGIKGGTTFTRTESNSTLVDVTGDGIDDVVFRSDGKLRYCAGSRSATDKFSVQYTRCGRIEGPSEILFSDTSTLSVSAEGFAPANTFGAVGYSQSENNTYVYLTDQDGDGLVDLAAYGQILYGQGEEQVDSGEYVVRFSPKRGLIPPIPGRIAKTALQARVPNQLRDSIRLVEKRLAEISGKLQKLEYSQTTLSWESPLDGLVSISGKLEFAESAAPGGVWPDDFTPAEFEALPGRVKPYTEYLAKKSECQKWSDEPECYQAVSEPFTPGYESVRPATFEFIGTPSSYFQVSRFDRQRRAPAPCSDSVPLVRDPTKPIALDLSALTFLTDCHPQGLEPGMDVNLRPDQLLKVKVGDVIHITFSVHPHYGKHIQPSVKFTYQDVDGDPVFRFLKYGKLTTEGSKEGIEKAVKCAWKDPSPGIFDEACRLAGLTRYEFDLSAGTLTSNPGARAILPAGTRRAIRGKFTLPDLSKQYDVYVDLLGAETTAADADRTEIPADPPLSRMSATSACADGVCAVDLSALCNAPNPNAPCTQVLADDKPYVLALRLTVLHKGLQVPARDINTNLASLRWSQAPAIESRFAEKTDSNKPALRPQSQDDTIVYLPTTIGDPDLEVWRVEDGVFDNPDNRLEEDVGPTFRRIHFAQVQSMELDNVRMARKRQTVDLCRFAREIADFLDGHISAEVVPFAEDYSGYWSEQLQEDAKPYGKRCKEADDWVNATWYTGTTRPDATIADALRLSQLFSNLEPKDQIASAQLLIGRVFDMLDAGEELLTDNAQVTRRGYRLPAKINPLSCETISSSGAALSAPLTSSALDDQCTYRVLANFAMLDFKDAGSTAGTARYWFSQFAASLEAAFELRLTATVNGVPIRFRELTGAPAGNDDCHPKPANSNTCAGAYGVREGDSQGYRFPNAGDDVFQRVTLNKRPGRTIAFSNSIMKATPKDSGLAECKRMPDYATSGEMERKQDCISAGDYAIDPSLKYEASDPAFEITYKITEANKFLGRNRIFEFQGRPLDVVQFHLILSPKPHPDVQTMSGETISGKFSLFQNKAGRQMIRRSARDILSYSDEVSCPKIPTKTFKGPDDFYVTLPIDVNETADRLKATCRPWTKLGWTELLLGAQYRTYSDAQRTGKAGQFSLKRRRELLRLFPEIEVKADQFSISDEKGSVPLLDELKTKELSIAGRVRDNTKVILTTIEGAGPVHDWPLVARAQSLQPLAGLADPVSRLNLLILDFVATESVGVWNRHRSIAMAFLAPSPQVRAVSAPTTFLVYDSFSPHVPKIGGSWAFFAQKQNGKTGQLAPTRNFLEARFGSEVYSGSQPERDAYTAAISACGTAETPNFEGCGSHLAPKGQRALDFDGVDLIPLIHHFAGPTTATSEWVQSQGSVCASELPSGEASCWQGLDDTILLESAIDESATSQPLFSISALIGFERPPIAEFLSEFDIYKDVNCLDRDWQGTCPKEPPPKALATKEHLPARPQASPEDALVETFAPIQRSESETVAFNGGAVLVNASRSRTNRKTLTSYQDVNGDGFPELISNGVAELTSPVGLPRRDWWRYFRIRPGTDGLAKELYSGGLNVHADSRSEGMGIGLSPSTAALFKSHGTKNDNKSGSPDPNVEPSFEFSAENGHDEKFTDLRDFNGDGLIDSIAGATVGEELGLTYSSGNSLVTTSKGAFDVNGRPTQSIYYNTSHSAGFGVRLGYSTDSGSFAAGMGLSHRDSGSQGALLDFTGDGRPDIVVPGNENVTVYPNLGNGFGKGRIHAIPDWSNSATGYSETTLVDGGAQFTYGFAAWFVKVVFNPGIKHSRNQTRELLQIRDINGDGMADIANVSGAFVPKGASLSPLPKLETLAANVYYNPDGGYYLLSGITTPTKTTYKLRHDLLGNEGPHQGKPIWALTEVARFDGFKSGAVGGLASDGQDVLLTRYSYQNGFYNRAERQFYGFADRRTTSYGCDEDNEEQSKRDLCLATVNSALTLNDAILVSAGFKPLQEVVEKYANRDVLTQGMLLSQIVRGATSSPGGAISAFVPVSRTVFGYSIDNLQCTGSDGSHDCSVDVPSLPGRWHSSQFADQSSALSPSWNGSTEYGDNGRIFGNDTAICSKIDECSDQLAAKSKAAGFDREQAAFWAQQSGSVRQRLIRLEVVAPQTNDQLACDFDKDSSCTGKSGLKSALAFDHDQWGQVLRLYNIAEAKSDWQPVDESSNHVDVNYARRLGLATTQQQMGYPLLGLAETVQIFNSAWKSGEEKPVRMREAVYPQDTERYAGRGIPTKICLYPGARAGFNFAPGICRNFGENLARALNTGQHTMQSALKDAYEADETHLPVGGATTIDAVILHQLTEYDDFGNLTHSVSPLSRSMDWIERRFSYDDDPFKSTATATELTRCVKKEPGAGADSPKLPSADENRCTFGLNALPEVIGNVGITHYSTARIDTHSGQIAEIEDINHNSMLYDYDRWGRLQLIARDWGNAPRENKTFSAQLKRAVAKTDKKEDEEKADPKKNEGVDGNPDALPGTDGAMADVTRWRILALANYSCMPSKDGDAAENCRSVTELDGVLRSNLRRFESADTYSGLLQAGNTTRESAAFADGLGRIIQTLNEADVCLEAKSSLFAKVDPKNVPATLGLIGRCSQPGNDEASGVASVIVRPSSAVDALGRDLVSFESYAPAKELAPRTSSRMRLEQLMGATAQPKPLVSITYDGAGRPTTVESRLASRVAGAVTGTTQFRYDIKIKGNGLPRFETLSMSPRCAANATWTDARGLTTNVYEGQVQRYIRGEPDAESGKVPTASEYVRNLDRTAEACEPIANLPDDWADSAVRTDYAYDSLQQLKRVDYPFGGAANTSITVSYDLLGRSVQMQERNSGCTRYSYDALDLLTSEAGFRFEPGENPVCGETFQARNEKIYTYSADRLKKVAYHSLDDQGGVTDGADASTFYYDRYPYASLFGTPAEAEKYVLNDQANQHLIDVTGRFCDNCIGQVTLVSDRSGARTFSYNELGLVSRELRSIVGPLEHVVKSAGEAETNVPELAAYEVENSYTAFGDLALEKFTESAPANPAEDCVQKGVDTCLARFSIGRRYSPDGALAALLFNGKTITSSAQDALGRPAVRWTANGSMTGYHYDPVDLRLNQMVTLTGAQQPVQAVGYQYDGDGNILDYRNRASAADGYDSAYAFTYDPVNRLRTFQAKVSASLGGVLRHMSSGGEYGYDARHRFTSRSLDITEAGQTSRRSWAYSYDLSKGPFHAPKSVAFFIGTGPSDAPDFPLQTRTTQFQYDEIGRMIGAAEAGTEKADVIGVISNRTMSWDGQGRLTHVRGLEDKAANDNAKWLREHYTYDAGGNRVLKIDQPDVLETAEATGKDNAATDGTSKKTAELRPRKIEAASIYMTPYYARPYNARGTVQLSVSSLPAVSLAAPTDGSEDPVATYLYADLPVGSMTAAVTAYGELENVGATLIARREYEPYGLPLTSEVLATARTELPSLNVFHGKELDRVTGFSNFGARYYSNNLALWLSPDPSTASYLDGMPNGGVFQPGHLSSVIYSLDNPIAAFDPDGRSEWTVTWRNDDEIGFLEKHPAIASLLGGDTIALFNRKYGMPYNPLSKRFLTPKEEQNEKVMLIATLGLSAVAKGMFSGTKAILPAAKTAELSKEAATVTKTVSTSTRRAIRSLEKNIAEHQKKISDFLANPTIRPGMEGLSEETIKAAQQRRVEHLQREIKAWEKTLERLRNE